MTTKSDGYIINLKMCYNDAVLIRNRLERTMVAASGERQEDQVEYLQRQIDSVLAELQHAIDVAS